MTDAMNLPARNKPVIDLVPEQRERDRAAARATRVWRVRALVSHASERGQAIGMAMILGTFAGLEGGALWTGKPITFDPATSRFWFTAGMTCFFLAMCWYHSRKIKRGLRELDE